jgi:hypothetical protein
MDLLLQPVMALLLQPVTALLLVPMAVLMVTIHQEPTDISPITVKKERKKVSLEIAWTKLD